MKVLIIEDESAAVRRLSKLILEIDPNIEIVENLDSIEATLNWLGNNREPDLLFMDIHLADGSSFEIFNHVKISKPIIFTTAYDQYALKAFNVNAVDYLLKPIKKMELEKAIKKYQQWQSPSNFDYKTLTKILQKSKYDKRFLIRFGQTIKVVEINDVAYFFTQDKITFLVNKKGKRYPIDYSLEDLCKISDPRSFFRINRQFIINIEAIKEMHAYSKSRVKILLDPPPNNMNTIVSTDRSPHFKKWLVGDIDE